MAAENDRLRNLNGGRAEIHNDGLFCEIDGITTERIQQMGKVVSALASQIYYYDWGIGTIEEGIAKARGFEIIEAVRDAGLTADAYKIDARYRLTNKMGWDVVRDFCGEGERLHHFIGTYSEKKQKVILCVATVPTGHRLCLLSRQALSDAQLSQADAILGVHFQREPFVWR